MNPGVVAVLGPLKGSVFLITTAGIFIGRKHPDNTVVLEYDDMVSRRHCQLQLRDGRVTVRDLESRNGTFVNGVSVLERVLEHGDTLKVGGSTFKYLAYETAVETEVSGEEETREGSRTNTAYHMDREQAHAAASDSAVVRALFEIASSHHLIRDSDRLADQLLEAVLKILPVKRAAILIAGHRPDVFVSRNYREKDVPGGGEFPIQPEDDSSILCAALTVGNGNFGVLYIEGSGTGPFTREQRRLLAGIAANASIQLEHARLVEWLEAEKTRLEEEAGIEHGMIGEDPKMVDVFKLIRKAGQSDIRVLITGETGTGKELAARAIHQNSSRSSRPFIGVNCAAIPESMRESELFGHEKGSFTGAIGQNKGKIEMADGGTLFLDEVGELSLAAQAALLRVLELGELYRVGGSRVIPVDVRVIAATNRDLHEAVKKGLFREDLLYRLNVLYIRMPSLRERPADIPILAAYFMKKFARNRVVSGFTPEVHRLFLAYPWPGNIRELRNAVERAVLMGGSEYIVSDDLPESFKLRPATRGLYEREAAFRKQVIEATLQETNFERLKAAQKLEISPDQLRRLMKECGVSVPVPM